MEAKPEVGVSRTSAIQDLLRESSIYITKTVNSELSTPVNEAASIKFTCLESPASFGH